MAKHRIGIIGCGMIARFHAAAFREIRGCEVVAGADNVAAAAEAFAKEAACESYSDYRKMLKRDDIDIVTICTPSGAHLQPAVAAARAGKHVIVEKPLEITLGRCDKIIDACRKAKVKLGVIFPTRFSDAAQLVKKTIDSGRLGKLVLGDAYVKWWRSQAYYDSGGWHGTRKFDGGGALMNQAIHAIDLLQWLAGPVRSVQAAMATRAHKRIEVEDVAVAVLHFRSGALGIIEGTTAAFPGFSKKIELSSEKGSISLEEDYITTWQFDRPRASDKAVLKKFGPSQTHGSGAADPAAIGHEGHRRQFVDFIQAIEKRRRPLIDGREGKKAVELILAIYKSARTGKAVKLPLK